MMNRYEMIYIIDADLEEAARKELIEKVSALITNNGGEIEDQRERSPLSRDQAGREAFFGEAPC